jgi:DNA-binding NtrC family response regulator
MSLPSSDSRRQRILAIGRDISLLSSGGNLLTLAGYTAHLVHDVDRAIRTVHHGRYHLAIVGSTFTYDEQITIRARLKRVRPALPVLLLSAQHQTPDAFLADVASCLKQKASFHFGTKIDDPPLRHRVK